MGEGRGRYLGEEMSLSFPPPPPSHFSLSLLSLHGEEARLANTHGKGEPSEGSNELAAQSSRGRKRMSQTPPSLREPPTKSEKKAKEEREKRAYKHLKGGNFPNKSCNCCCGSKKGDLSPASLFLSLQCLCLNRDHQMTAFSSL